MSFGSMGAGGGPMVEMNTTPLVDVMLVLLVVFILIAPVVTHRIKVDLPEMIDTQVETPPVTHTLQIDADGNLFWDEAAVSKDELKIRLEQVGRDQPDAEVHIAADEEVTYEQLAWVMGTAQTSKVTKMGFISAAEGL